MERKIQYKNLLWKEKYNTKTYYGKKNTIMEKKYK